MRMVDIIHGKRIGHAMTDEEIAFVIKGCTDGSIPDYQLSAWLMAVCINGMNEKETTTLTTLMARSGDMVDLSGIAGIKADKHSTGGVGDKTSLIVTPIVAACGVRVAKMSGRGLGHTGGTIDKLESIPGFRTTVGEKEFIDIVNRVGLCIAGQSGNLAPADKKLYALRDVTATIDSIPLIAASIMSKKLAAGADCILLDTKTGSGAFMKTPEEALVLAQMMVAIGERAGRRVAALITNMDIPLGRAIGNAMEVKEAILTLQGVGPTDLTEICLVLASDMLWLAGKGSPDSCRIMAEQALRSGSALERLSLMVEAQGGDPETIAHPDRLPKAPFSHEVRAAKDGYIAAMNTEEIGRASMLLGAGRLTKESPIDMGAGILLAAKTGNFVREGESIATLFASGEALFAESEAVLMKALQFSDNPPKSQPLIYARVTRDGTQTINN